MLEATSALKAAGIPSARLDAELLLAHILHKPREYLLAHPETQLKSQHLEGQSLKVLEKNLERRVKREPIAYILGEKEFYGRMFRVTPDVLIPRPESEVIIDMLKQIVKYEIRNKKYGELQIVDIGTGSGCLAVTAKLEWPDIKVIAIDTSKKALQVAKKNAQIHKAKINFFHGSLLEPIPNSKLEIRNSILIANLPYVDPSWEVSPETAYEPSEALFTKDNGLFLIKQLMTQTTTKLRSGDMLLLEADPRQHEEIITVADSHSLKLITTHGFILQLKKI